MGSTCWPSSLRCVANGKPGSCLYNFCLKNLSPYNTGLWGAGGTAGISKSVAQLRALPLAITD